MYQGHLQHLAGFSDSASRHYRASLTVVTAVFRILPAGRGFSLLSVYIERIKGVLFRFF
ncbi:hypothetical protein IRJ41_002846 [Triplophysa rosa]|uniref:Uncharacterized protein n=1 Tax=Triplophysa rosa TaxID=992332 RepID=A0A9W7WS33_TRIRA|nr:hypothetical protein IRJ41_002846 [Triplophysa rosa]